MDIKNKAIYLALLFFLQTTYGMQKKCTIHKAAKTGNKELLDSLIKSGITVNTQNWTVLHYAAANGYLEVVKWLIDNGVDINAQDLPGHK
jgi:ankyrin repeat protein